MRRTRYLLILVLAAGTLMPLFAHAQESSLFGPIIPASCRCDRVPIVGGEGFASSAPGWGCIIEVVQNVINVGIALGIVFIVLMIVWAGFTFMTSGANPEARKKGRQRVMNAVVGLAVILVAWLAVDFVMKALYDPSAVVSGEQALGPWNSILAPQGDDRCLIVREPTPITSGFLDITLGPPLGGDAYTGPAIGSCSPANLISAAAQGGVSIPSNEAQFLACVSRPESGCGVSLRNYNWGRGSSAYGPFQILLGDNAQFFEHAACYEAAGVSGPLNCGSAFRNGNPIPGKEALVQRCQRAAANLSCSTIAAHRLFEAARPKPTSPWTGNDDSTQRHQTCKRLIGG